MELGFDFVEFSFEFSKLLIVGFFVNSCNSISFLSKLTF
jgi:hypothetical protein